MDHDHPVVLLRQAIQDASGAVPAAVVDDDQLRPGRRVQHASLDLRNRLLDGAFLIVGGHYHRQGHGAG